MKITEIKRHLDGREERFQCDVLTLRADRAVVRFEFHQDDPRRDGPFYLPAGTIVTHAYFWEDRHYLVYKLMGSDGTLYGHRFDVCEHVHISRARKEVRWTDLMLDLWIDAKGAIYPLDEDEVERAHARGWLTQRQLEIIEETKAHVLEGYRRILREIGARPP